MVPIRAVVFGVSDVMEDAPKMGVEERWEPEFGKDFHTGLSDVWAAGAVGAVTLDQVHEQLVQIIGAGPDRITLFMEDIWTEYLGQANQEMHDYLAELRSSGYMTSLICNSFVGAREREEERYGFSVLSDFIVYSHEVGFSKPDPRVYALCLERHGVEPDEVVVVSSSEVVVAGARAMGMHGVVFEHNHQTKKHLDKLLDR